jgi:hypothetical protein
MKRILRQLLLPLLGTCLLVSCKDLHDITFRGLDNVVLHGMENNKVSFSADVSMYNPSSVNIKVSEVNLKTIVDGTYLGTLTISEPIRIKAKTDSSYHTGFSLQIANLFSGGSALYSLSRKKQVTVEMQGFVRARSWLIFRKIAINEKRVIDVPSLNR